MFHDNETDLDLLGVRGQVDDVCAVVTDPTMLPVTVGLLVGDWGPGSHRYSNGEHSPSRGRCHRRPVQSLAHRDLRRCEDSSPRRRGRRDRRSPTFSRAPVSYPPGPNIVQKVRSLRRRVRWFRVAAWPPSTSSP